MDHDSKARERRHRILFFFKGKENCDELGLGSVLDSFADRLFPGTNTIQTSAKETGARLKDDAARLRRSAPPLPAARYRGQRKERHLCPGCGPG
ncbi:MAG: DUF6361 family protein [Desulfobulbus sp.]|nr:DUF6361 family protein [Desulfobulbus sp.]